MGAQPFAPRTMYCAEYVDGVGHAVPVRVRSRGPAAPGCLAETYLYEHANGLLYRCSVSMLHPTQESAHAAIIRAAAAAVQDCERTLASARLRLVAARRAFEATKAGATPVAVAAPHPSPGGAPQLAA